MLNTNLNETEAKIPSIKEDLSNINIENQQDKENNASNGIYNMENINSMNMIQNQKQSAIRDCNTIVDLYSNNSQNVFASNQSLIPQKLRTIKGLTNRYSKNSSFETASHDMSSQINYSHLSQFSHLNSIQTLDMVQSKVENKFIDLYNQSVMSTSYPKVNEIKIAEEIKDENKSVNLYENVNNEIPKIFDYTFQDSAEYTSCAGEYLNEIYNNLLYEEKNLPLKPIPGYMKNQDDINSQMRAILIDWLVEVHLKFRLRPQTMYQTLFIIDTYLSYNKIKRVKLQLLGIAALFISCKEQEIYYPKIDEFTDITDKAYNKTELLEMEEQILQSLNFNILAPTSLEFYDLITKSFKFDLKQYYFGKYFLESAMIDDFLIKYTPSTIACACAYIVMKFFGIKNYSILYNKEVLLNECPQKIIKDSAREICYLVKNLSKSSLKGIKDKYMLSQFLRVAELCEEKY